MTMLDGHIIITCVQCSAEWDVDYEPTQCQCDDSEWTLRAEELEEFERPDWLDHLIEMARDWRFSNEFLGSVFRYRLQQADLNDGSTIESLDE